MLLAQILGSIFGLFIAWLIHLGFERHQDKKLEKLKIQHQLELEQFKKSLKKSS
jgi:hypothetical protein